jgi:sodium pump decarboxylase gamma subunit
MDIRQGVYVTILGMALVFAALLIVMLVTVLLDRIFRSKPEEKQAAKAPVATKSDAEAVAEEGRIAAVIAATLAILDQESEVEALANLPESVLMLERIPQGWKAAGRFAGMH